MYRKILIPLEHSPTDQAILDHIRPLVRMTGAELILVHVADGFVSRFQDDQRYLDTRSEELAREGFHVKAILTQGKEPADRILNVAQSENCDLIALATHGHRFVQDVILGSVAENLRHRTHIPVLMIQAKGA